MIDKGAMLVSVIVPCFNAENFIAQTLNCLLEMDYTNWECVIVNDGSTDNSQSIVESYCSKDSRFISIVQQNLGPAAARNAAIANSKGEYILPLDADDLISKSYVSEAVALLDGNPSIKLVYCNARMFGRRNRVWKLPQYSFRSLLLYNLIFCTAMYRRSDFLKTRGYDPTFRQGMEDWDFWIELLKSGGEVYKIEKEHFFYRTHKKSRNKSAHKNAVDIRKQVYDKHRSLYENIIDNPIQLIHEHTYYKKKYNFLRRLMFQKPIP